MEGIFLRKKANVLFILLFFALFIFMQFGLLNSGDASPSANLISAMVTGTLLCLFAIPSLMVNRNAYIRIEENRVKARYHLFGKLDCAIDEIEFVFPQPNILSITLKNGKRHIIMGLENAWELSSAIRRQSFQPEEESPDALLQELRQAQAVRKKGLWGVVGGVVLMFANIFIALLLTGGRELEDFTQLDWILFSAMGVLELATMVGLLWVACWCGRAITPIEKLQYRLRGAVIASQPLPAGVPVAAYTDENFSTRFVVCGFPNDESVYYCVQEFAEGLTLKTVHTSSIFANKDALPEGFRSLIELPLPE